MDAMIRRRMMMAEAGGTPTPPVPVPYDTRVEYLACTGAGEKIDTGFYPTEKTRVTGKVMFTNQRGTFFCSRWTSGDNTNTFTFYAATYNLAAMASHDGVNHTLLNIMTNNANRYNNVLDIDFDVDRVKVYLNGNSVYNSALSRGTAYTSTSPLIYFNFTDAYITAMRIYESKIYEDGVLVHSYIPVRVGQVGYLYDEVANELKGNTGSGDFVFGNDIN